MESRELDRTLDRVDFLEHKLLRLRFLVTTAPGIPAQTRERLLAVIAADSFVGIETEGEVMDAHGWKN